MQQTGRMDQCWVLNSYAARLIVALNYHEIDHLTPDNEEILSAVFWCYYLDRTLSSLFIRPMSLPEPCMPLDQMLRKDESMAYGTVVEIISDLAQVQGELLDISLNGKRRYATEISARCEHLRSRMHVIHNKMEAVGNTLFKGYMCRLMREPLGRSFYNRCHCQRMARGGILLLCDFGRCSSGTAKA